MGIDTIAQSLSQGVRDGVQGAGKAAMAGLAAVAISSSFGGSVSRADDSQNVFESFYGEVVDGVESLGQAGTRHRLDNHVGYATDLLSNPDRSPSQTTEAFDHLRGAYLLAWQNAGESFEKMESIYGPQVSRIEDVVSQFERHMGDDLHLCYGAVVALGEGNYMEIRGEKYGVVTTGIEPTDRSGEQCFSLDEGNLRAVWDAYPTGKKLETFHELSGGRVEMDFNPELSRWDVEDSIQEHWGHVPFGETKDDYRKAPNGEWIPQNSRGYVAALEAAAGPDAVIEGSIPVRDFVTSDYQIPQSDQPWTWGLFFKGIDPDGKAERFVYTPGGDQR